MLKFTRSKSHLMRISGLIQTCDHFHQRFFELAANANDEKDLSFQNPDVAAIHVELATAVESVEKLCREHKIIPADLPNPSFRAYQWLKFLRRKPRLLDHLKALRDFYSLSFRLVRSKKQIPPKLAVRITYSNYLYRISQEQGLVSLHIHEGFISAPVDIKEQLVLSAFNQKNQQYAKVVHDYNLSETFQQIAAELNAGAQINRHSFKGNHINLKDLFDKINQEYFGGNLQQPRLMWSARRSTRRLGYYDPHSNTITINRRFDTQDTPRVLVEYVMYHEMLHQHLGIHEVNGRKYAHTREFKRAEKRFKEYRTVEKLLKNIND